MSSFMIIVYITYIQPPLNFLKFFYVYGCFSCIYVCTLLVCSECRGQMKVWNPLKLEFLNSFAICSNI